MREKTARKIGHLCRHMRIVRALDTTPVDPFKKHRQLRRGELNGAVSGLWPHKVAALEALGKQTKSIPTPPQDLHSIPSATPEDKQVTAKGILFELCLYERCEAVKSLAHVGRAGCDINPRRRSKPKHRLRPIQYGKQAL